MDKRLSRILPPGADTKATMKNVIIWLSFAAVFNIFVTIQSGDKKRAKWKYAEKFAKSLHT